MFYLKTAKFLIYLGFRRFYLDEVKSPSGEAFTPFLSGKIVKVPLIDINDVIEILQDIALNHNEHLDQALEILTNNGVEIPTEIRHRQFSNDVKHRLGEIVRFIHNEDSIEVAQSRIDGITYDLIEYLNSLSNE